jgi:hypothetical protein
MAKLKQAYRKQEAINTQPGLHRRAELYAI